MNPSSLLSSKRFLPLLFPGLENPCSFSRFSRFISCWMQLSDLSRPLALHRKASSASKQKKFRDGPFLLLPTVLKLVFQLTNGIYKATHCIGLHGEKHRSGLVLISPVCLPRNYKSWHTNERLCAAVVRKLIFSRDKLQLCFPRERLHDIMS